MTDQNGPPIKVEDRTPHDRGRPSTSNISSHDTANNAQRSLAVRQLGARRAASQRLPVLEHSGRSDPWRYPPPGERGYQAAALHLLGAGLVPSPNSAGLRAMWRRGGHSRRAAEFIAERWELAA